MKKKTIQVVESFQELLNELQIHARDGKKDLWFDAPLSRRKGVIKLQGPKADEYELAPSVRDPDDFYRCCYNTLGVLVEGINFSEADETEADETLLDGIMSEDRSADDEAEEEECPPPRRHRSEKRKGRS